MADDDIQYTLDPSGYLVGVNQIDAANQRLQASMGGVVTTSTGLQRALNAVTPGRAAVASLSLLAQQASGVEQQLSGLSATSAVTGVSVSKLGTQIRQTARDMPVGFDTARMLTEQYTRMGVAGAGSENKIAKLVTTTAKLSGATGEGPGQLASGMVDLARATGNQNLDPARFSKLSDSLTTVSAKMGASATSTLAFSKSIAPMAQNAGIGATGVLGISAAFSRLGEDGVGASTAVNKMLSDMNRAVREGSPEMRTYAQIAGMTATQFERLYKANPTEALTQVTESIAKAGPGGPRMLEQLGLDGVRSQRALQALVASGGLRPAVAEATAAYGSGSTDKAAAAAYSGLNDSLIELRETSQQLAEAFGRPLLGPLTAFTTALKGPTSLLAQAAGSKAGQTVLTGGLGAIGLMLAARQVAGPLGVLAMGRQAATSGPLRSLFGGFASGAEMDAGTRTARYGAAMTRGYEQDRLGPVNSRLFNAAYGFGADWRERNPRGAGGPSLASRIRTNARAYGYAAVQSYTGMVTQQYANAMENDPTRRSSAIGMAASASAASAAARETWAQGGGVAASVKAFHTEMKAATGTTATFRQSLSGVGAMLRSQSGFVSTVGKDVGRAAGGAGMALARTALNPAMLASMGIVGAIGVYSAGANNLRQQSAAREEWGQSDIASSINAYRESIGKATTSTQSFISTSEALSKNLAKIATTASATTVTADDKAAAAGSRGNIVRRYAGTTAQIASQVAASSPGGMTPDELQAVKVDLLRQMGSGQVQDVLRQLPGGLVTAGGNAGLSSDQVRKAVTDVATAGSQGTSGPMSWFMRGGRDSMGTLSNQAGTPGWLRAATFAPGGGLHQSTLTDAGKQQLKTVSEGIAQQTSAQSTRYGANYATQEQLKAMNAALKAAYQSGNGDAFLQLSQQFGQQLGGADLKDKIWSPDDFKAGGFDFGKMVAGSSRGFASQRQEMLDAQKSSGGNIAAMVQSPAYVSAMRQQVGSFLADAFDPKNVASNQAARSVDESLRTPEDVGKQADAVQELVDGAKAAGKSMSDLAIESAKAAQQVGPGGPEAGLLAAVQQRAQSEMMRGEQGMTTGQAQMEQYRFLTQRAQIKPTTQAEADQRNADLASAAQMQQDMRQRMVQRLQVQRQADVSAGRAQEDYTLQAGYAKEDYGVQRQRAERNFQIAEERQRHSYQLQVQRSEEDFYTSRERALRDFSIAMQRGEEDFNKNRARQMRDFNIGLKRQVEDAAASLYDPYARIQTKATYDAGNLMLNLREQTEAMAKQKSQLDALRKLGLSQQSIDILGLGKTENAQQLNNLAADAATDPKVIAQLNAQAKARQAAAGALTTDDSNKDLRRQKEDLAKSLKDSNEDYAKSVERARADLAKGLGDSQKDFRKTLARNATDFAYNLAQSRRDLNISMSDMETDFAKSVARQKKAFDTSMARMRQDVVESDLQIAGSFSDLAEATNRAIHGQAVNWQTLLKNDTKSWVKDMKTSVIPQLDDIFSGYGVNFKSAVSSGGVQKSSGGGTSYHGGQTKAEGGTITGFSPHPKADNIPVMATAGEFMQPVHVVNHYGVGAMEAMRQKRIPKELIQGFANGGLIEFGNMLKRRGYDVSEHPKFGGVHPVHTNGSQHYNKRGPGGGGAIDVNADPFNSPFKNEKTAIDSIVGLARGYGLRTLWQVAGHFNHAHFDIGRGADMVPMGYKPSAGGGGANGYSGPSLEQIMSKMKNHPGPYNQLTTSFTKGLLASDLGKAINDALAGGVGGDTGAHGKGAAANQAIARRLLSRYGWGQDQMPALIKLWNGESGWNERADNPTSDAYGIPQALPGSKMASEGADWRTNPETQIRWGLKYIKSRPDYGSPAKAWAMWQSRSPHWYDKGGKLRPGSTLVQNDTGKVEHVLTDQQWADIRKLAARGLSKDDLLGVRGASGVHIVVNNRQSYHYDQRNDFGGASIVVQADDPRRMARELESAAHADRLTQTRGVKRSF